MYVHLGSGSDTTAELKVTVAANSANAKWNILTQQIGCSTAWTAPDGCSMWLTGVTNSWSMYGYKDGQTTVEYIPSHNYNVCIRQEAGYCSIRHEVQSQTSFELTAKANNFQSAIGKNQRERTTELRLIDYSGYAGSTECYTDFITIPNGSLDGNSPTFDRHCGHVLSSLSAGGTVNQPIISKC